MRKPVMVEASQEFAVKTFPIVAELICLAIFPLLILGSWIDQAIKDFNSRDGKIFDN